jgi:hypothetical protein
VETDLIAGYNDGGSSVLALGSSPQAMLVLLGFSLVFLVLFWRTSRGGGGGASSGGSGGNKKRSSQQV